MICTHWNLQKGVSFFTEHKWKSVLMEERYNKTTKGCVLSFLVLHSVQSNAVSLAWNVKILQRKLTTFIFFRRENLARRKERTNIFFSPFLYAFRAHLIVRTDMTHRAHARTHGSRRRIFFSFSRVKVADAEMLFVCAHIGKPKNGQFKNLESCFC